MTARSRGTATARIARRAAQFFTVVGVVCLGAYAYFWADRTLYQWRQSQAFSGADVGPPRPEASEILHGRGDSPIGRIEIPRLGFSAVILPGVDERTLRRAVGHVPGTAAPGEAGNVGLAAHRDTFFRVLRNIKRSDQILVTGPGETSSYRVESLAVVEPSDAHLLAPAGRPVLTLVTCYPFTFVGPAPKRLVVRAVVQSQGNAIVHGADRNPRSTGNQGRRPIPANAVRNKPPPRAKATRTVQTASPEPAPDAPRVPIDSVQSVSQPRGSPGASVIRVVSFPFRKAFGFARKPGRSSDEKRHEAETGDRAAGPIRDRANENMEAQQ